MGHIAVIDSPVRAGLARTTLRRALPVASATVLALLCLAYGISLAVQAANETATWTTMVPVSLTEAYPSDWLSAGPVATIDADTRFVPTGTIGGLVMFAERPDSLTRVLAIAAEYVPWLAGGAIVLLMLPVVRSITAGRPFAPGNARALAAVAGVAVLAGVAVTGLPFLAARRAISAEMGHLSAQWFAARLEPAWWPWSLAAFATVLALAVRQGSRVAAETEGLV